MMCMNFVNNTVSLKIMSTLNIGLINSLTGIPSYFCSRLPSNHSFQWGKIDEEREIIRSKPEKRVRGEGWGTWHTLNMCISTQHCNRAWQKQKMLWTLYFLLYLVFLFLFFSLTAFLTLLRITKLRLDPFVQTSSLSFNRHVWFSSNT